MSFYLIQSILSGIIDDKKKKNFSDEDKIFLKGDYFDHITFFEGAKKI